MYIHYKVKIAGVKIGRMRKKYKKVALHAQEIQDKLLAVEMKTAMQERKMQADAAMQHDRLEAEDRRAREAHELKEGKIMLQRRKQHMVRRERLQQHGLNIRRREQNIDELLQVNDGFRITGNNAVVHSEWRCVVVLW